MAQLPLGFEANRGQTSAESQFLARTSGSVVFLTSRGALVKTPSRAVRMDFAGVAPGLRGEGVQPLATEVNYLTGPQANWRRSVPSYGRVQYRGIYPGVDLAFYGNRGQLEYDLQVAAQADPGRIRLAFAGVKPVLASDGALQLGGGLMLRPPQAYQTVAGKRRAVAVRYVRGAGDNFGFGLGAYDHGHALIIDPVLAFSTLLGGTNFNQANAVAVDSTGAGYVAGFTLSPDFPTVGPIQANLAPGTAGPNFDAFIAKIKPDGTALIYSTYLGGNGDDEANGIAVDSTGAAYVAGFTSSTNFPVTAGV
ncbi:MAG: SBBP repeat-containing protein, partial [Streptosporangiaceae bacterium]